MRTKIEEAMKLHGLTIEQVAKKMGVRVVVLDYYMDNCKRMKTLSRIAKAIGCDVSDLIPSEEIRKTLL